MNPKLVVIQNADGSVDVYQRTDWGNGRIVYEIVPHQMVKRQSKWASLGKLLGVLFTLLTGLVR
jgi:hypothetical protein